MVKPARIQFERNYTIINTTGCIKKKATAQNNSILKRVDLYCSRPKICHKIGESRST